MLLTRRDFIKLGLGVPGTLLVARGAQASDVLPIEEHVSMLYDTTKCIGCRSCQNACKSWNKNPPTVDPTGLYDAPLDLAWDTWTMIKLYREDGQYSFSKIQCNHCVHPACVSACPVQALSKVAYGPVLYDAGRCIGCRYCMVACPFRVPRYDWHRVLPQIKKCTFCNDRLETGIGGPRCAEACPTGANIWGRRGELLEEAKRRLRDNPGRYVNHIYGEDDVGGTSVLYLAHVDFQKLGPVSFPSLGPEPVPELSERVATLATPGISIGIAAILGGLYWFSRRRERLMAIEGKDNRAGSGGTDDAKK